jgi:TolA-binding protein
MSQSKRNHIHRNQVGLPSILGIVVWILVVVGIWGMQVTVKQSMGEARHRIEAMQGEMDSLADKIESLRTQKAIMLSRDALRLRLEVSKSDLVPISLDHVHHIRKERKVEMAMRRNGEGGSL